MSGLRRNSSFHIAVLVLAIFPLAVFGQQNHLSVNLHYGHPDIQLQAVTMDADQLVYLATNHGYFTYDGRSLEGLSWLNTSSKVSTMSTFGDSLVVGHKNGVVTVASIRQRKVISVDTISNVSVEKIVIANNGVVALATAGSGVVALHPNGNRDSIVVALSDGYVNDILLSGDKLTIATDRGVDRLVLDTTNGDLNYIGSLDAEHDLIQSLSPSDEPKELLAWGHSRGLGTIAGGKWKRTDIGVESKGKDNALFYALSRNWWVDNNKRICELMPESSSGWSTRTIYNSTMASIAAVFGIAEGYLMVWLENGNLDMLPVAYEVYNQVESTLLDSISAICPSSSGGIWAARNRTILELKMEGGLPKVIRIFPLPSNLNYPIVSLAEQNDQLLAGSFGEGLFVFGLGTNRLIRKLDKESGLPDNSILDIADGRDKTWFSTMSGVVVQEDDSADDLVSLDGAPAYVYSLHATSNDQLYVGSQGESMFKQEGRSLVHVVANDSSGNSIVSIAQDAANRIWGLTTESELLQFSASGILPHPLNDQLKSLGCYRLFLTPLGHIGLISENALFDITHDGIAYELLGGPQLFASSFQHISTIDQKGQLWVARPDGLVLVNDHSLKSFHSPRSEITSLRVENELQPLILNANFPHDVGDIAVGLKSVWHDPYRPVAREYRMLGLDTTWRTVLENELRFAHLTPGEYKLEIRTLFGPTMNTVHSNQYAFTVLRPFYLRWWFLLLVVISAVSAIVLAMRWRERRMAAALALKSERIQTQFEVLKNQINPHFLFNSFNTLAALIPDDPKKAELFTEKLSAFFREILTTKDNETNTLARELELAADFVFLQQARYGTNLRYRAEIDPARLTCELPTLSLQILLENAIKHNQISRLKPLDIIVRTEGHSLIVTNNLQLRTVSPESTGLGLNNLSNRLQILTGKNLEILQRDDQFCVTLPLVKCN